jgi:predicted AAA+ superfamily ATPase
MELNSFQLHVLTQMNLTSNHLSPSIRSGFQDLLKPDNYLLELGATICVLPRQSGKTTLCKYLAETQGAYIINGITYKHIQSPRGINNKFLVIDEFMKLDKLVLKEILSSCPWSKVLLIGSYI